MFSYQRPHMGTFQEILIALSNPYHNFKIHPTTYPSIHSHATFSNLLIPLHIFIYFSSYSFKLCHFWCVCLNFSNCPNIIFYSVEIHKLIINNKVILSLASNDHTGQMFVSAIDHLFKQS